jgi:hypothetical protein
VPRFADGTLIPPQQALETLTRIPGLRAPVHLSALHRLDFGPGPGRGVAGQLPPKVGEPYPYFVPAVDSDGNEIAGIRHPELAAPLATYTGWVTRDANCGAPGELVPMAGATYPFARTAVERRAAGDPRPSIEERYGSEQAYLAEVRAAAEGLVAQRLLLAEDVERVVVQAAAKYKAFMAGG